MLCCLLAVVFEDFGSHGDGRGSGAASRFVRKETYATRRARVERIVAVSGVGEGVEVVESAQWVDGSRWSRFGLLRDDWRARGQFRTGVEASKAAIVALPKVWSEHTCSDQLNQPFPFADRRNTSHMQWRLTEEES
jgi:hypothetical protein